MSIAKPTGPATTNSAQLLAELFAPVSEELSAVTDRLQSELRHSDPFINELAQHSFRIGGKRLRPALLLLAAQATGQVNESHRVLAAVVEMIHTATLVHDDVLDEADVRRHVATANARWDNQTSVLLGDYLFTHAFYLASTLETTFGCRAIGRATNIVCEGELKQTAASGDFELSRKSYFEIIEAKTAELCAVGCELGAHYSGATGEQTERLRSYGRQLGIAFQIADDLLDLEGQEEVTGKSLGTDLIHQKMTLPLIHLRDQLGESPRAELKEMVESSESARRAQLLDWLMDSGSLDYARGIAEDYTNQAIQQLASLQPSVAKSTLTQIAQYVAYRES